MKEARIAILRWQSGQVPEGLMQLGNLRGNSTNPESYPFPVEMVEVPGANLDSVILHPSKTLLENMIRQVKRLEEDGVTAVSTSCGFNAVFQEALADAVDIPVFTSSLLQVPFAQRIIGSSHAVAVITANGEALSPRHLAACGITDEIHTVIVGLEHTKEWSKLFNDPTAKFNMEALTDEILSTVRGQLALHPEIRAIVLECTDLPPYAEQMRREFHLPVFDINSLIGHMAMALSLHHLYEPEILPSTSCR